MDCRHSVLVLICGACGCLPSSEPVGKSEPPPVVPLAAESRLVLNSNESSDPVVGPEKLDSQQLPNLVRLTPHVISGGFPDGDEAFAELRSLGIKTVISVDGMKPNVELAAKHGLRYVHLPHGYDGVPVQRAGQLAKAVRELPGPIYIHCHHGKHRSPAAAATACIGAGLIAPAAGLEVLKLAGTSENYQGLYNSVRDARQIDSVRLHGLNFEFKEVEVVPALAEAMVELEERFDKLKPAAEREWPSSDLNTSLAHEALLVRESYTEMLRMEQVHQRNEEFIELMRGSERAAELLEAGLRDLVAGTGSEDTPETVRRSFETIAKNCKACHQQSRDLPLQGTGK